MATNWYESVRLVASDMDGTLTFEGQFCASLLDTLSRLQLAEIPLVIVTGRSAGWVSGLTEYLPIAGAIAENGGLFYSPNEPWGMPLVEIGDRLKFRQTLSKVFRSLQRRWPQIQPSSDNLFRITDWTFDNQDLSSEDLDQMARYCNEQGWSFTYSSIQCHVKSLNQSKQTGLLKVLEQWPGTRIHPHHVLTCGDSPNDESLFDPDVFPYSFGVANLRDYLSEMRHHPAWITEQSEYLGVRAVLEQLLKHREQVHG